MRPWFPHWMLISISMLGKIFQESAQPFSSALSCLGSGVNWSRCRSIDVKVHVFLKCGKDPTTPHPPRHPGDRNAALWTVLNFCQIQLLLCCVLSRHTFSIAGCRLLLLRRNKRPSYQEQTGVCKYHRSYSKSHDLFWCSLVCLGNIFQTMTVTPYVQIRPASQVPK